MFVPQWVLCAQPGWAPSIRRQGGKQLFSVKSLSRERWGSSRALRPRADEASWRCALNRGCLTSPRLGDIVQRCRVRAMAALPLSQPQPGSGGRFSSGLGDLAETLYNLKREKINLAMLKQNKTKKKGEYFECAIFGYGTPAPCAISTAWGSYIYISIYRTLQGARPGVPRGLSHRYCLALPFPLPPMVPPVTWPLGAQRAFCWFSVWLEGRDFGVRPWGELLGQGWSPLPWGLLGMLALGWFYLLPSPDSARREGCGPKNG